MSNKLVNIEGKPISPGPPQLHERMVFIETKSGFIFVMPKYKSFRFQPGKKLSYYTKKKKGGAT